MAFKRQYIGVLDVFLSDNPYMATTLHPCPDLRQAVLLAITVLRCYCCPRYKSIDHKKSTPQEDLNAAIFNMREIQNYDNYERQLLVSHKIFEKSFGQSSMFIASTLVENSGVPESTNPAALIK